ncbi:MAG: ATP-binding protein [Methanomassiliicoccaceae archaeon]|nr:ATP-binding protein [Methanomassiliicoccaceae archaeon]
MSEALIPREHYLKILRGFKDKPLVKIITGMRRCGKTSLMETFIEDLRKSGVPDSSILHLNFEKKENSHIKDGSALLKAVDDAVELKEGTYLFFDEVQDVTGWEKAINSMRYSGADVYITGSNAKLLVSDFSTYLSGRYVEVELYPLSFREYAQFAGREKSNPDQTLLEYMINGGLPQVTLERKGGADTDRILSATFETVFIKDVIEKNRIMDAAAIRNIAEFAMKNIGNITSTRSVSNYIVSKGGKITPPTVDSYLDHMEAAYLFYRAKKYDVKTKEYLRTANKFYIADLGIRNNVVGYDDNDISGLIENIVFMELLFRGKKVSVGKIGENEIDFIVTNEVRKEYFQVTMGLFDQNVREREVRSLKKVEESSPKTIITFQRYPFKEINGIRVISLADFLLEEFE